MLKLISLAIALAFASPALAQQQPCKPLPEALSFLKTQHQEIVIWGGRAEAEIPVGLIITQAPSGTWTILQVVGNDACLMASGTDGQILHMGDPA